MTFLNRAIDAGYAEFVGDGPRKQIRYIASGGHIHRYSAPEEKVRADFWAELIFHYGYSADRIDLDREVPDRKLVDPPDIVIFRDGAKTKPYAVIETKADGISDGEFDQAVEQACGNGTWAKFRAEYVGVVAGLTRRFLDFTPKYGVLEREANIIADLPRLFGKPEDFRFYKGDPARDIKKIEKGDLIATIRKCHQTLWGGGRLSPPAAFSELCKIIFVKIIDETALRKNGEPYQFQIRTHETKHRLAERIRELYAEARLRSPDVLAEDMKIDDGTILTVVSHLETIDLTATDPDVKGLAFEQFMGSFFKGDSGQYFTPREVVNFIVRMFPPDRTNRVIDPACGSGGFLLSSLHYIRDQAIEHGQPGANADEESWKAFAKDNLFGIEINDEIARVAKMNMILHGDGRTNVVCADGLATLERLRRQTGKPEFKTGNFQLVLTNPPFGAQIALNERPYLGDYDLGQVQDSRGNKKPRKSQKTEILFIERVWELLEAGARAAIIVPDGILTNASLQYVRDFIVERFRMTAVVSLPTMAFTHYGTAVKASVLFLYKRDVGEAPSDDEPVFMAAPEKIGYDSNGTVQ